MHTCTRPGLPLAARALCWKSGLLVMVCGRGSVDTGPPLIPWEPVQGACATQSFRAPGSQRPLHMATPSAAHLGLPWLRVSRSCCRAGHGGQGAPWVTFACVSFQPRSTPFSQNRLRHSVQVSFSFCLLFNLYLDSFETLQSDLTLELSVAGAPHATGVAPKHLVQSCWAHRALPIGHLPRDGGHCPRARLDPQPGALTNTGSRMLTWCKPWSHGAGSDLCCPGVRQ